MQRVTSDEDTCISLYDYKGNLIGSSDDTGEDFNMKLSYEMTARERYYFEIKYYDLFDENELLKLIEKNSKKSSHKKESCSYNIVRKEKGEMKNDEKCRN